MAIKMTDDDGVVAYRLSQPTEQLTTLILGLVTTLSRMAAADFEAQQQEKQVPDDNGKVLYTADDIGELLSLSPALIHTWGREGKIRRFDIGEKFKRYKLDEVLEDLGVNGDGNDPK